MAADVPQTSDSLIISFGEVLIDFVPTVNGVSLAEAPAFKKAAGGAPANVAVGIARLGGKAAFVGKTGEDEFGHMLADLLKVCAAVVHFTILLDSPLKTRFPKRSDGQ